MQEMACAIWQSLRRFARLKSRPRSKDKKMVVTTHLLQQFNPFSYGSSAMTYSSPGIGFGKSCQAWDLRIRPGRAQSINRFNGPRLGSLAL